MPVTHFALFIICIVAWFIWIYLSWIKYRQRVNPISLYTTIWFVPTCMSMTGLYELFIPDTLSVLLIVVNVLCYNTSCLLVKPVNNQQNLEVPDQVISEKKKEHLPLILANVFSLVWLIPFIRKMLPVIISGNWSYARALYLLASTNHTVYTVLTSLFLQWIVTPIFYVTSLLSAYYVARQKPNYFLLSLSAIDAVAIVLATAGRNAVLKILLFYFFAFVFVNERKFSLWKKIRNSPKIVKLFIVVAVFFLGYITFNRKMADDTTIFQNIYTYFVGPIVYFNSILDNTNLYGLFSEPLLGRATFGFVSTPLEIVGSRLLGFDYRGADNIITSYVSRYMDITPTLRGNAFSTSLYPFMMDFGWLGVGLGPVIFGQITERIFRRAQAGVGKNEIFWKCLMIFIVFVIIFSEWEYELIFPYTGFVVLFLYLFVYKKRVRIKK